MHNSISSLFVNIARGKSAAHAYIIEGRAGAARDGFVKDFTKGLNCMAEDPAARPCGECASCRQIAAGTSMDVYHMSKSGKTAYKVAEDVEPFIERMSMGSYGRYNIGIIDEGDLLGEVNQNKLLKTLEEPEEGSLILLAVTNRDNLLSTVRSRCSIIRMADYVEEEPLENSESLMEIAGQIVECVSSGNGARRDAGGAGALAKMHFFELRGAVDKKVKTREEALELLGIIEDACRDKMVGGEMTGEMAMAIDLVERARMDIQLGMNYGKALRRLYLELA